MLSIYNCSPQPDRPPANTVGTVRSVFAEDVIRPARLSSGHIHFMSITRFLSWLTLASIVVVAGCTTSKPASEQLAQLVQRTSALEQQVHNLEVTNAELQKQLQALQPQPAADAQRAKEELQKKMQESDRKLFIGGQQESDPPPPRPPRPRNQPPTNQVPQVPHLTPLDTK